ncbi:hypothetical protein NLJ89_g10132 [Agrocybe chaxingu]|uniref:VWFA domain-containing protein n=1 Tax=Agrocybe chaxingu TaxID=84603 RepID=A0A9W8MSE9_9AGAR|nr:hypothetical protein NLJ89_g10132 [Agrocybe chaxingu]
MVTINSFAASSSAPQDTKKTKPLDVVFVQDTTGSQGPYITSARKAIRGICDRIAASAELSQDQIRFGLIAFRDHPPQDTSYVTKEFGFTSDIAVMQKNLASLIASGGGDGPEAQTAAIAAALNLKWAEDAIKMVILITDSPPHGLGEYGDGFDKSPDQNDPLQIARQMAERGITLFVIACEPALSMYKHAVDFYSALAQITSGRIFPLTMADKLGDYIVGTAIETIETENLIGEFEKVIVDEVFAKDAPVESVVDNLQEFMKSRGVQINSVTVEGGYAETETFKKKVNIWHNSKTVGAARTEVKSLAPEVAEDDDDNDDDDGEMGFSLGEDSEYTWDRERETGAIKKRSHVPRGRGGLFGVVGWRMSKILKAQEQMPSMLMVDPASKIYLYLEAEAPF